MSDNYAKLKSRKYASDDDAENLLAGILDETEDVAKAEQERIEAELKAKEDEERRKKEEEARRKKEEAAARLNAELERLEKVEQRRTAKLEALKIEELKEKGEWVDPEEERRKLEEKIQKEAEMKAMKEAAEAQARRKAEAAHPDAAAQHAMPAPAQKSNNGVLIGGIVLALLIASGAVAAVVLGGYEVDKATYSKAVFAPKDQQVALVEKGVTPIPKDEPVVQQDDNDEKDTRRRRRPRRRAVASKDKPKSKPITGKPKTNKANKRANELEDMLNTDIFGSGP